MRGQSKSVLVLSLAFLGKHVLPTLYPKWADVHQGGMGKGQLRAFVNDLRELSSKAQLWEKQQMYIQKRRSPFLYLL